MADNLLINYIQRFISVEPIVKQNRKGGDHAVHRNRSGHVGGEAAADGQYGKNPENSFKRVSDKLPTIGLVGAKPRGLAA